MNYNKQYEKEADYSACLVPPNYPVPSLLAQAYIDPMHVGIHLADENIRCAPVITWWKQGWRLPEMSDHGIADYTSDIEILHPASCRCEDCRFWGA